MGLKDLFSRWSKREDSRAVERAQDESQMTNVGRDVDQEDFEARKDDIAATSGWAGSEAASAAGEDLPPRD
jgi:hypothetical protein